MIKTGIKLQVAVKSGIISRDNEVIYTRTIKKELYKYFKTTRNIKTHHGGVIFFGIATINCERELRRSVGFIIGPWRKLNVIILRQLVPQISM